MPRGCWLNYPPDYENYVNCRTWWMTRRPTDTVNDGLDVLLGASMFAVDSAHSSMRRRVRGLQRRVTTSSGTGLSQAYSRFDNICADLWVYLIHFNFCVRKRAPPVTLPRAVKMGLAEEDDCKVRPHAVAWDFRLGVEHAREIS